MEVRDELVKMLQQKVGLDASKAGQAADAVVSYLKESGPELIQSLFKDKGLGKLGDMFGGGASRADPDEGERNNASFTLAV